MKRKAPRTPRSPSNRLNNTSIKAQRQLLAEALLAAPEQGVSTIQARHELNIMAPAPRIYELRHIHGMNIITLESEEVNPEGYRHRCARYFLLPGKWRGISK